MADAPRRRTARSLENDERILDAATSLVVAVGIDALGLRDVAAASGLSYGSLYGRYENVEELWVDLWERRLAAELDRLIAAARDAAETAALSPPTRRLLCEPPPAMHAAIRLAIAAHRVPELGDVVPANVAAALASAGMLGSATTDPLLLGVVSLLLGAVIAGPVHGPSDAAVESMLAAIGLGGRHRPVGETPVPAVVRPYDFGVDDAVLDALLHATVDVVARSGLQGATVKRIGRVAHLSPSTLYGFYPSRDDLLRDLVSRCAVFSRTPTPSLVHTTVPEVEAASLMSGLVLPAARVGRRLSLEFMLGAGHDAGLAEVIVRVDRSASAAAASVLTDDPVVHRAVVLLLDAARDVSLGLSLLADLVNLRDVDWRPFAFAVLGGLSGGEQHAG